jgi:hypothetical protein
MVNKAFAERYGPDLVGRHFTFDQFPGAHEIVGIVGNLIEDGAAAPPAPYVYACSSALAWPDPEYVIRTRGGCPRRHVGGETDCARHRSEPRDLRHEDRR